MPRRSAATKSLIWLRDSATCLFVINPQRRIALFNFGCEQLSGFSAEEVLGQRVEATTAADPTSREALLAALMPPLEAWNGKHTQLQVDWPRREMSPLQRTIDFWPVLDAQSAPLVILGIVYDPVSVSVAAEKETLPHQMHRELARLRRELHQQYGDASLIGCSSYIQCIREQIALARLSATHITLIGEAGTGKEYIARLIHHGSAAASRPFLMLDAGVTPLQEIKTILKLPGALHRGSNESDSLPGTIYLQNVESAGKDLQERLLQWLDASAAIPHRPRLIVGNPRPLTKAISEGQFDAHLARVLSPLQIELPALRERTGDISLLAQYFLEELNRGEDKQITGFDPQVLQLWQRYRWPGHLDELRKVVSEMWLTCTAGLLLPEHLPFRFRAGFDAQKLGPRAGPRMPLDTLLEHTEREAISQAVADAGGNLTQAADLLQIPRARLYRRLESLGLRPPDPADSALASPPRNSESEEPKL